MDAVGFIDLPSDFPNLSDSSTADSAIELDIASVTQTETSETHNDTNGVEFFGEGAIGAAVALDGDRQENVESNLSPSGMPNEVRVVGETETMSTIEDGGNLRRSSNRFASRVRFGGRLPESDSESEAVRKARFWAGVKPLRHNSSLFTGTGMGGAGGGNTGLTMATLRAAIKLKKKAINAKAKSALSAHILDPRSPRMRAWKNWTLVNIMYTVLVVPWRISFMSDLGALGLTLNGIANVSFVIDTVLHFFTALPSDSGLVIDHKLIIRRYLTTWFALDLVTCVPLTTLLRNKVYVSLLVVTPLRSLRLLGLLKVVKVYTVHYEVSPVAMSICKTLVTVILAAHLLSCLWFWVHCYDSLATDDPKPWKQCGRKDSSASQYLSSFYFIIYTLMTVGYGDVHADADSNKGLLLSVGIQLTGATLFGFIIAATRRIVQFIAPIQKATTANLQEISEYAVDRRLPDGVSSRIMRHFRYFYFKTSVFDERAVMKHVPWQLCQEVVSSTHAVALSATGLLQDRDFSPTVLLRLARALKPMEVEAGDETLRQGDVVLQVYFVIRGRIEGYVRELKKGSQANPGGRSIDTALRKAAYVGVWGPGSMWGLNNVLLGGHAEATFVAVGQSDLLWLDQLDLVSALEEHPSIRLGIEKTAAADREALRQALDSDTILKDGLKIKQISLTDFKPSDLKQQLKHADVQSLCMAATADKAAYETHIRRREGVVGVKGGGSMSGMAQDFRQLASMGSRDVRGRAMEMVAAVRGALGGRTRGRAQLRLVRTWRTGQSHRVHNWMGQVVEGVMETEETPEELNRRMIVLPDQPSKLRWDVGISMVCVLVAVLTPFRMAFAENYAPGWMAFDAAVDILFVIDIGLRMITAYVGSKANNEIVYITVPGMIFRHYLRGGLVLDVASTIPIYLLRVNEKAFRGMYVLKLLRVGRVSSLAEQLHRLSEQEATLHAGPRRKQGWLKAMQIDIPGWCMNLLQILMVIYYSAHIFGCLWWAVSRYDVENSWWVLDGLVMEDTVSTYIASLYWAATTITTVGYGDLVPTNDVQRGVACLTMICGTTMFSYVIGSVSTLLLNPSGGQFRRSTELLNVNNYLEEMKVGEHLCHSVRGHMIFIMGAKSAWDEEHILSRLPPSIREKVVEHVHREAIEVIPILKTRPLGFASAILRHLRPQMFLQGEVVYKHVEMSQGIYFVTKGIAEAYAKGSAKEQADSAYGAPEETIKGIVAEGNIFGYTRFLAACLDDDLAFRAFSQLHVYLLSNTSVRHILHYHPFLAKELRTALEEAIFAQASDEITTERKKHAARRALYGDDNVTKRCPDPPPPEQKVTSALTSYLRRESLVTIKPLELQQPPEFLVNAGSLSSGEGDDREGQSMSNASGVGGGKLRGRYELEDEHGKHSKGVVRKVLQRGALQFSDDTSSGSDGDFSLPPPGYNGFILTQLWNEDPVGSTPRKNRDGKGGGAGEPSRASSPMMEAASSVAATFRAEMERKDTVHTNRAQEEARGYDGSHRGLDVPVGRNSPQVVLAPIRRNPPSRSLVGDDADRVAQARSGENRGRDTELPGAGGPGPAMR